MAKDPAVLFYTSDFLSGVADLTMEERGQYITLLCLQHQKGRLPEKSVKLAVNTISEDVLKKFKKDEDGNIYNLRMEEETARRIAYSESRKKNRKGNISKSYDKDMSSHMSSHMENETENENINKSLNENEAKNLLIPKMFSLFKTHNPTYLGSVEHDYKPLMSIARFLAGQGNIDPIKDKEQIFEVWELLSEKISKDNFYCQKTLLTISNHIQSIAQTSVHGKKQKLGTSAARTEAIRNW